MKYIVLENPSGLEFPIIFPSFIEHSAMLQYTKGLCKAISAGECKIVLDKMRCFGRSVSLNLESRYEIDENLLNRELVDYF
jgi:hypothetical protein